MAETLPTSHARRVFAERLAAGPLLLDGAMGTLLYSRGTPQRASLDELVLSRPDVVSAVHREYIAAGADIIETDSFTANRHHLQPLGLGDRTGHINRRAAQLAREAREVAGVDVLVAGSIGPVSSPLHGPGHVSAAAAAASVTEQLESLLEGGIDIVQLETSGDIEHLLASVEAARRLSDLPVVASITVGEDLSLADGTDPATAARMLQQADVDVIGVNCGSGPIAGIDALEAMAAAAAGTPLLIMPNAGLSGRVGGEFVWAAEPAYFAQEVPGFLDAGARLIGGCCGTTPEHIAAMRQALDRERARRAERRRHRGRRAGRGSHTRSPATDRRRGQGLGRHARATAAHGPGPQAGRGSLRRQRRDRPAALGAHRAHARLGARSSVRPAQTWSTSATAPWPACAWVPWPWASPSSVSWSWSRSSTSPRVIAT